MNRISRTHLVIAAVALVAAFLVASQARTERQVRRLLNVPSPQLSELAYRMQGEERRRVELEVDVVQIRRQIEAMTEAAGRNQRGLRALSMELREARLLAGFAPMEGPGVLIELADNPRALRSTEDPNDVLLHYTDLIRVVADLWAAGAEAIAINDERLIGTSAVECVGTTVLVNQRRLTPPFRITAIGDPGRLVDAAGRGGGGLDMLRMFGFPVRVVRLQNAQIPAFRGAIGPVMKRRGVLPRGE
jgi:uncharacterized protein YlxW (UPF0749 family)